MPHSQDRRLDLWVETNLLRRSRSKRFSVPGYSKYPNLAMLTLHEMEVPFTLTRSDEGYSLQAYSIIETSPDWENLALAICRILFRIFEGTDWNAGDQDAENDS
jgi:hypothetical protein